jgi:hypothetical protein
MRALLSREYKAIHSTPLQPSAIEVIANTLHCLNVFLAGFGDAGCGIRRAFVGVQPSAYATWLDEHGPDGLNTLVRHYIFVSNDDNSATVQITREVLPAACFF